MCSTSSNAIPATVWLCLHIFRNADLLSRVRQEVAAAMNPRSIIDVIRLCSSSLLQSLFAETLRLYSGIALMRSSDQDFVLDRWRMKKNRIVFIPSRVLHHNPNLWNTGTIQDPHPVEDFWEDRFLEFPKDSAVDSESSSGEETRLDH